MAWLIEPFRKPCLSFLWSPPADLWLKATRHDQVFAAIGSTAQPGRNPFREATDIEQPVLALVDAIIPVVGSSMPAVAGGSGDLDMTRREITALDLDTLIDRSTMDAVYQGELYPGLAVVRPLKE